MENSEHHYTGTKYSQFREATIKGIVYPTTTVPQKYFVLKSITSVFKLAGWEDFSLSMRVQKGARKPTHNPSKDRYQCHGFV